ncbi:MAG: DNA starvation/stationary phase protection protein [Flavobacteriales bacterium]|nr:DNA starvation/stationary phase protection protein [Flavobacteriales bacterium]
MPVDPRLVTGSYSCDVRGGGAVSEEYVTSVTVTFLTSQGKALGYLRRKLHTPMSKQTKNAVVDPLATLLASSYTLYLKTHNYHWNVTGPMFTTLHTLFMTQYTELALAVDEVAERIRTLGAYAPGSYTAFMKLSKVKEENGHPNAKAMIKQLVADQAAIIETAKAVIKAAEKDGDQVSADLATRRMDVHAKNAWMLRSHLE